MIQTFPQFTKLDLSHKSIVEEFYKKFPAYSEFGFANMFIWDTTKPIMLSLLNENLVVQFVDFKTNKYFLTVIGTNAIQDTIKQLIAYAEKSGHHTSLHNVPEHVVDLLSKKHEYDIVEELESNDYILSIPYLVELEGPRLSDKRHKINHFHKTHGEKASFKQLDLADKVTFDQMQNVIQGWLPSQSDQNADIIVELTAINKALIHHKNLSMEGYGVYIGDTLEAFTLIEKVHNKMVVGHFEKGNKSHTGIYEYMNHNLGKHLHNQGYEYLNICQDMGQDGLRRSKMSYQPVDFHRKYTISHKPKPSDIKIRHQPKNTPLLAT